MWFKHDSDRSVRLESSKLVMGSSKINKSCAVRLRFTGTASEHEFQRRCSQHDFWYHSFYFDNGFEQRGSYDIGRDINTYGLPSDMRGMSVLDVGTGSGWFATYFEQCGADVTTIDVRGYCDFDVYGRAGYPDVSDEKTRPDRITKDGEHVYFSPVSGGFWIMKDLLGLKARHVNSRVYDVKPALFNGQTFDLVFAGALLMHLRDPIAALMALRTVTKDRLMANCVRLKDFAGDVRETSTPLMRLLSTPSASINWWAPNESCFRAWFDAAGFTRIRDLRTVNLTADRPFTSKDGISDGAANQALYLIDASVR